MQDPHPISLHRLAEIDSVSGTVVAHLISWAETVYFNTLSYFLIIFNAFNSVS